MEIDELCFSTWMDITHLSKVFLLFFSVFEMMSHLWVLNARKSCQPLQQLSYPKGNLVNDSSAHNLVFQFLCYARTIPTQSSMWVCKKSVPLLPISSHQVLEGHIEISLQPSLLQANQSQRPQSSFIREMLQPSEHPCGPSLALLQQLRVLLVPPVPGSKWKT